jgi:hypothetical protein
MLRAIDFHRFLLVSYLFSVIWFEEGGRKLFLMQRLYGELAARRFFMNTGEKF